MSGTAGPPAGPSAHPLAEQALGPFSDPRTDNASPQVVIDKVLALSYKDLFLQICPDSHTALRYECIGRSIAAYERSGEVSQFTSSATLAEGQARLTGQEQRGLALFRGRGSVPPAM